MPVFIDRLSSPCCCRLRQRNNVLRNPDTHPDTHAYTNTNANANAE
jgi:hypothetical protein